MNNIKFLMNHVIQAFRLKSCIVLLMAVYLSGTGGQAQIPNNSWRDHLPYNHAKKLVETRDRIYCLTSDGSLFSYNINDNSLQKHSKITGLSDAEMFTIGYSEFTNTFFIGYKNGNIDLVRNDSIINIPDIKRKMIAGEKSINNVFFSNQYAYLACGFGIVVCDLYKGEIKDTYIFGSGGIQINVNDITSDGTYLYAATETGIYKADMNHPNLSDYTAWQLVQNLPDADIEYRFVVSYNNEMYTVYHNEATANDEIIIFNNSSWETAPISYTDQFGYLGEQHGYLILSSSLRTKVFGNSGQAIRDVLTYYARYALFDSRNILWYADPVNGLVRLDIQGNGTVIFPDGPENRSVGDMEILNGQLWAGGGTDATKWAGYGAYALIHEKWKSYNASTVPALDGFLNISEVSIDPTDPGHIIGGSYGYGIAEFENGNLIDIFDETDGILQPVQDFGHGYVRVTGTDFDNDGNLWVSTSNSNQAVYYRSSGASFEPVQMDYEGFGLSTNVGEILVSSRGQIWLLIENKGILVFESQGAALENERFFLVWNQVPDLLENVYAIAEDKEGDIWVGTNKGIVVYSGGLEIFTDENIAGYQPEIPRNDGSSFVDLLLSTVRITDIAVDGANQKWITTEKSGVFLVSADGKKEIHHFTEENSPLLSNSVQSVAVNDQTGEVFFGTEKGLISFRGRATEGGDDFGKVYVFPNPVREDYSGDITVTGLLKNALVKITDINGNLVFETTAQGGQAVWDGRNFRGQRVQSGVYMVFCTNEDGTKTHVTKLLFIH